ncbi:DNA repair protein [Phyllobacterium sp. 628]|uniref:ImuA family protein n=1 Tax=Phyllobacterium sp. 628 TaxID=2718938 RepID=UPI001662792C|nr:DNA repair protein [Phyllobacterium sp. 628]QND51015.1 DNA repair protein [Phyllobacterium sp. 628]
MTTVDLGALRRDIAALSERNALEAHAPRTAFDFGDKSIDAMLSRGLQRGALHEVFSTKMNDAGAATGFVIALALRSAGANSPILWLEEDFAIREHGFPYAPGLENLGLDPERLIIVRCASPQDVLKAAADSLGIRGTGAVIIAPWSNPKCLDLTASRKLLLTAQQTDVPAFLLRLGATPADNSAVTRWLIRSAPSQSSGASAPGHPVFDATLIRNRQGMTGHWILQWESDEHVFRQIEPVSGTVVSTPAHRPPQTRKSATG